MVDARVCLISGGTRGLGSGIVSDLLAAGWSVATYGRVETPSITTAQAAHGDRLWFSCVDASDAVAVATFAAAAAKRFGRVDALINNVGVALEGVLAVTRQVAIHHAIAVNLESAIVLSRAVTKVMLRQRSGHIINISSVNGLSGTRGMSVYSATKAGLDGFTRSLARELGGRDIRVNSIAPGYLETEMTRDLPEPRRQQILRRTPLGRLGTIDDIVGVVRFLLSPAASFITGQTFVIDGGLTC